MTNSQYKKLAQNLVTHSVKVTPNDNVLIEVFDLDPDMTIALVEAVAEKGGKPFVEIRDTRVTRAQFINGSDEFWTERTAFELDRMKKMQCYIAIRANRNSYEYSDVPSDRMSKIGKIYRPVTDHRVKNTRWCVLRFPNPSMAQGASMSTEAFEKYYFDVCLMDYSKMAKPAAALVELMNRTSTVHIEGPGETNFTFSIKDIPAIACVGEMNIPDGEVFTAPVKYSVNGVIQFNTPTVYEGKRFENIRLVFKDGKIIKATSSDTIALNAILDTDDGATYVGEFALGFNPYVKKAMCDILFDEKIAGSIHFTPGACYDEASNGNNSSIHWDMVLIQTPEYGGGKIWFDDVLVRLDGVFILPELFGLNEENLKG